MGKIRPLAASCAKRAQPWEAANKTMAKYRHALQDVATSLDRHAVHDICGRECPTFMCCHHPIDSLAVPDMRRRRQWIWRSKTRDAGTWEGEMDLRGDLVEGQSYSIPSRGDLDEGDLSRT